MARVTRPLFARSRHPMEAMLAGERDTPSWFAQHGVELARRFLRSLREHPAVKRSESELAEETARDVLGRYAWARATVRVQLRGGGGFQVDGSGYAKTSDMARVIAHAEVLERLALQVGFAHAAPVARLTKPTVEEWSSNGCCFHSSATRVVKGALCELLERDAFLTSWYAGRALPGAEIGRHHALHELASRFAAAGWRLREHAWKHDAVDAACVYLSIVRKQPVRDGWNFFLGGAAGPTHGEAMRRAADEALRMFRTWHAAYDAVDHSGRVSAAALANVASRLLIYQRPSYVREFERMTSAPPDPGVRALRSRSDRSFIVHCLRRLGDVAIVPLPVPIVLHDRVFCIKAVSSRVQNLDWETPPHFNMARIRARFGTRAHELNRFPHPIA